MKHKIKKILIGEIILIIITIIAFISYKVLVINEDIVQLFEVENILEMLITIYIPSSILIIYHLIKMLKPQLYNPLFSIKSKLLEKKGFDFSKDSVIKISSTFSSLLENEKNNILWELEHIELNRLEQECLNCDFSMTNGLQCNDIHTHIRKHRRIRITTIADSLILRNSFFSKNEYFATETRLPSSIIDDDREYYNNQKENLKKYKPKKACRLLILKKNDIKKELNSNRPALKDFIKWNNVIYREGIKIQLKKKKRIQLIKEKKLQLKIIVYNDKLDDVFSSYALSSFYDFVVSKKRKHFTVFAQNESNVLTSYDSSYENSENSVKLFYDAFQGLFNHDSSANGIAYSEIITSIDEAETFINNLN